MLTLIASSHGKRDHFAAVPFRISLVDCRELAKKPTEQAYNSIAVVRLSPTPFRIVGVLTRCVHVRTKLKITRLAASVARITGVVAPTGRTKVSTIRALRNQSF